MQRIWRDAMPTWHVHGKFLGVKIFDPAAFATELLELGFGQAKDVGPEEINERYFADRNDNLKVGSLGHLMKAVV